MGSLLPEIEIFLDGEPMERDLIEYAIVWKPEPGWLRTFPNLQCIVSIGAGIDHILCDPELPPNIPDFHLSNESGKINDLKIFL